MMPVSATWRTSLKVSDLGTSLYLADVHIHRPALSVVDVDGKIGLGRRRCCPNGPLRRQAGVRRPRKHLPTPVSEVRRSFCFSAAASTFVGRQKDGRAAPTMDHGEDRVCNQATTSWTWVVALMVDILRMCPLQSISAGRGCLLDCSPAT